MSTEQLRAALRRLRDEPECGKLLGGALRGCRSIRVGGSENRLVYQIVQAPKAKKPTQINVIALGRRRADAVYNSASERIKSDAK